MIIGRRDPVRRSSTIGCCGAAVLDLIVFNCRSLIAILPRRQHVVRYVHASIDCRVILECSLRLFRRRSYRGRVDGDVLLFHLPEEPAGAAQQVEEGKRAELLVRV